MFNNIAFPKFLRRLLYHRVFIVIPLLSILLAGCDGGTRGTGTEIKIKGRLLSLDEQSVTTRIGYRAGAEGMAVEGATVTAEVLTLDDTVIDSDADITDSNGEFHLIVIGEAQRILFTFTALQLQSTVELNAIPPDVVSAEVQFVVENMQVTVAELNYTQGRPSLEGDNKMPGGGPQESDEFFHADAPKPTQTDTNGDQAEAPILLIPTPTLVPTTAPEDVPTITPTPLQIDVLDEAQGDAGNQDILPPDIREELIVICHRQGGQKKERFMTIEVAQEALSGHIAHGDTIGECIPAANGNA